jgi:Family of unknown function (DUF6361)
MKPQLGWTLLSKDALKRAEAQLAQEIQGVRDEIGFLAVHQAYADRFFPGTSVLHTRLRYVLFVPWLYERIQHRGSRQSIERQLQREELLLTGRLKRSAESGVIGGRTYPKPSVQPPSMVYWTALGSWGILRPLASAEYPGRALIHRLLAQRQPVTRLHDDEHELLEEGDHFFAAVPDPPKVWLNLDSPLDFNLRKSEAKFLRKRLISVRRPGSSSVPSLMAQLVDRGTATSRHLSLWSPRVASAADIDDRAALERARQAASLSAIGRAVYSAMVEEMLASQDKVSVSNEHRHHLKNVLREHREDALALDIPSMVQDAPMELNSAIVDTMAETQLWLKEKPLQSRDLYDTYKRTEARRKGVRARLPTTLNGRDKRAEWAADPPPLAQPLHYRWDNVLRLLLDLEQVV